VAKKRKTKAKSNKSRSFWIGLSLGAILTALIALLVVNVLQQPQPLPRPQHAAKQTAHTKHAHRTAPTPPPVVHKAPERQPQPAITRAPQAAHPARRNHGLALIIDDVGYDLHALRRLLQLSVPIAISVLPDAPYARQAAALTQQYGQTLMLHLPMQPEDPSIQMSPAFLREQMQKTELQQTFIHDLAAVPGAIGVNNHMGSRLTQSPKHMRWVMEMCRDRQLFFVDSRTSWHTVAAKQAQQMGLAWAERKVFLDHVMSQASMQQAWDKVHRCLRQGLRCVIIAHPRPMSVAFLEQAITPADAAAMVSIQQLLQGGDR